MTLQASDSSVSRSRCARATTAANGLWVLPSGPTAGGGTGRGGGSSRAPVTLLAPLGGKRTSEALAPRERTICRPC